MLDNLSHATKGTHSARMQQIILCYRTGVQILTSMTLGTP